MRMMEGIIQSKSKIFFISCICFLFGVSVASVFDFRLSRIGMFVGVCVSVTLLLATWGHRTYRIISICFCICLLGIIRYGWAFPIQDNHIIHLTNQKQTLVGHITAEPDIRMDGVRYIMQVHSANGEPREGRVYIAADLHPQYAYGDILQVSCRLKAPEPIETFRYDMYLARFRVFVLCTNPRIQKIGEGRGYALLRSIFLLKGAVAKKINILWHEPYASFMAGLLYGYRGGLGSLNALFATTGVTHIIAISGYNITIIASILIAFCTSIRIPRKKAFWLVVSGIAVFVLFAGASASVVRAGIMGVIVLLAKQVGRASQVGTVMIFTAVLMAVHTPLVLLWDAGFQLSFVATLGLVYLTAPLEKVCWWVPEWLGIRESFVSTLAAIIATLPLILYQFGRLSIVAPMVNMLILWVLPWIMLFGFVAVCISTLFPAVGVVISWVAFVGMKYIVLVVTWFAHIPFAAVDIRISAWSMGAGYVGLAWYLYKKKKSMQTALLLK